MLIAYVPEIPQLINNPSTPSSGWTKFYYNSELGYFVFFDESRNKWLSDASYYIHAARNGFLSPGSSFRTTDGLPTSVSPIIIEKPCTLIGIVASTSVLERFQIQVEDVSIVSSPRKITIDFEAPGPTTTRNLIKLDLNQDFNVGDLLDIYVLSSVSGNISNPHVKLLFRYRV